MELVETYLVSGYLNNYGFCVKKNILAQSVINHLKKYFKVIPTSNYADENDKEQQEKAFEAFYEDDNYLVLPKFIINVQIDLKTNILINNKNYNKISFNITKYAYKKNPTNFKFTGNLREPQKLIVNTVLEKFNLNLDNPTNYSDLKTSKGGLIKLGCGSGKCLAYNTEILMFDGTIKLVQDVKMNDKLMGDDSTPRLVQSLARGKEMMYKINTDINYYSVNESHILSLVDINTNEFIDISVQDYLKLDIYNKNKLYGYRVPINFEIKEIEYDAYLFGYWLGCNNSIDDENFINFLEKYNLNNSKYIPQHYKSNCKKIQIDILAGIIDAIGKLVNDNYYITENNKILLNDIIYISRSLGLVINYINTNTIKITKNIKTNNYLYYSIKVEKLDIDYYYGFEIDKNKRFVLGDFTVTHNTVIAIYLSHLLQLKTLIIVHKEFLMDQWIERYKQFTDAKIGIIRQDKIDSDGKDVVIAMAQSISMKDYDQNIFNQFGLVFYDEVHHLGSRVMSQALLKTSCEYTIGLSATPERSDGLLKVIKWHIGEILYTMDKKIDYKVLIKKIYFRSDDILFKEKKRWFQGRMAPNNVAMIDSLINISSRNKLIVQIINTLKNIGRKILILSYRVDHIVQLKSMVDKIINDENESHIYNTYFYMGNTKKGERKMAEKDGDIIFATMQLAEEGLDIAHLDTIIFALPVSVQKEKGKKEIKSDKTLIQSIGRILRNEKLEVLTQIPLVIDISDILSIYSGWSSKRDEVYGNKNWYIQNYYFNDENYIYSTNEDKKNPMNLIFDDISNEEFIENNLIIKNNCEL
jgi:superfamily II DNA or RNA helicase